MPDDTSMRLSPAAPAPNAAPEAGRAAELRSLSVELEASFLAEMLKHAGFGEARGAFGGGPGEEQFASLLRLEHARGLAAQGGIGLAESLFNALVRREGVGDGADTP